MVTTVRGMMYYRQAIKLQAFLDMAEDDGMSNGFWFFYLFYFPIYLLPYMK